MNMLFFGVVMNRVVHVPLNEFPSDAIQMILRILSECNMKDAVHKVADVLRGFGKNVATPKLVYLAFRDDPAVKETFAKIVKQGVPAEEAFDKLCTLKPNLCILVLEYDDEE